MKRPRPTPAPAPRAADLAAAACLLVGTAAAFSGPASFSTSVRSSSATTRPPLRPSNNVQRWAPPTSLQSSLEEALATGATNGTGMEKFAMLQGEGGGELQAVSALGALGDTAGSTDSGVSPQQGLREVLSSPELLDPAAVLDATIGIDLNADSLDGPAGASELSSYVTTVTPANLEVPGTETGAEVAKKEGEAIADSSGASAGVDVASFITAPPVASVTPSVKAAVTKEEDLELTLQAIMRHIDKDASDAGIVDDEDESEGEKPMIEQLRADNSQLDVEEKTSIATTKKSVLDNVPTVPKILRFTLPAIGIWLCSPVLSMIDTAAVGLLSGTAQQAALNPAVSVTDYGALVVAFMYTATTNLISAAVQEDKDDNGGKDGGVRPKTTTTLITALKLALGVGSVFALILGTLAPTLLKMLIGNDSLDPAVFAAALRYVRIRSLGMPAAVVMGTAQSACLGMRDVRSPLYVLLAAAVINFLGDVMMVPMKGALLGGAAGAAWATVASQYAALVFFGRWLTSVPGNGAARREKGSRRRRDIFRKSFPWLSGKKEGKLHFLWRSGRMHNKGAVADGEETTNAENISGNVVDVTQGIMELTGTSKAGKTRRKEFRKFLASSKLSRKVRKASAAAAASASSAAEASKRLAIYGENRGASMDLLGLETTSGGSSHDGNNIRPVPHKTHDHHRTPTEVKAPTRGFLSNSKLTPRSFLSFSRDNFNGTKAKEFLPFVVPVTTTSVGRISGYIAMSHVASSTLGTFDMAGHQIVFSIFCCLTPFVDALSQVAQSFVPAVFEAKDRSKERAVALRRTVNNFRKVGVGFGALLVGLVSCIPLISRWFTTDPIVLERVTGAVPGVGLFMLVNGLMCAGEGSMLGQKDLKFLRNMYAIFFFTVPAYMLRLKHRALTGAQAVGIGTMWAAFSTYNVIRTSIWHLRLAQLQRRTEREADIVDGSDSR